MMRARPSATAPIAGVAAALCFAAMAHAQQTPVRSAPGVPRTAWGTPDLQGTWTGSTITPLERPKEYANKPVLTPQEAAALEARARTRNAAEPARRLPPPDPVFLERAWSTIAAAASNAQISVILGTERIVDGSLVMSALVINRDGTIAGFQDKVQIDPSEEATYAAGEGRRVFQAGPMTFGIAICHEGWRYPETVRWAAKRGAQVVFHPHFHGSR
jgi:hypothetical protein